MALPTATALARTQPLSGRVIALDPGHGLNPDGGGYTGAHGVNGAWEDVNVLDVARRLATLLRTQGATVILTRGAYDPGPPPVQGLIRRVASAERSHADVFVSIHQNDSSSPRAHGVSTYYDHTDSRALAQDVQQAMVAGTGLADIGTLRAGFYVLRNTTMPAILVEGGFLSNPTEARRISTAAFHRTEAQAIDQGLLAYFGATGTGGNNGTPSAAGGGTAATGSPKVANGPIGSSLPLARGDRGHAVRVLQGDLDQLGWKMVVTGTFNGRTASALAAFQRRHGVAATGVLNGATLDAIEAAMGIGSGSSGTRSTGAGPSGRGGSSTAGNGSASSGGGTASSGSATGARSGSGATFRQGTGAPAITGGLQVGGKIDGLTILRVVHLVATAYGATAQDNYPYGAVDAFGVPLKAGDVAVDPGVIPLNTRLYVTGYKTPYLPQGGELATARDTGGAIKGDRIDMYINSKNESLINSFGIQHVTAYILGK